MTQTNLYLLLILLTVFGCKSKQSVSDTVSDPKFHVCPVTRMLLVDLNEHLSKPDATLQTFQPDRFQETQYAMNRKSGNWYIRGILEVGPDFNPIQTENKGIMLRKSSGNFYAIEVPLKEIETFFGLEGVNSFEIDKIDRMH